MAVRRIPADEVPIEDIGGKFTAIEVEGALSELADAQETHEAETVSYQTFVTRDLSLTGTQKIILPFKAKSIQIKVTNGTLNKSYSDGFCDEALNQRCTYVYPDGTDTTFNTSSDIIRFTIDNSNVTDGNISLIEDDGITITWSKIGSGATGTAVVNILAMTH